MLSVFSPFAAVTVGAKTTAEGSWKGLEPPPGISLGPPSALCCPMGVAHMIINVIIIINVIVVVVSIGHTARVDPNIGRSMCCSLLSLMLFGLKQNIFKYPYRRRRRPPPPPPPLFFLILRHALAQEIRQSRTTRRASRSRRPCRASPTREQ